MQRALSFFTAMTEAEARHENQLTRALLVVLRMSPVAHMAWLRLVAPEEALHALPPAEFRTQRARLVESSEAPAGQEPTEMRGVSVLLAPDVAAEEGAVSASERTQVLDGIVQYGEELVTVIENKIAFGVRTDQPYQINTHGMAIKFAKARTVRWQLLLDVFADLVSRGLVSGAERLVLTDFLDLVESYFPKVGPFSNLARCGGDRFRIERRLDAVLAQASSIEEGRALGNRVLPGRKRLTMAFLNYDTDPPRVLLRMYPGDTLEQARAFYAEKSAVLGISALVKRGWSVVPDFHWGALALGVATARHGHADLRAYCQFWMENIESTKQVPRSGWQKYWATLERAGIVGAQDREAFDAAFTRTQRHHASPRPGICCEFSWSLDDAQRLDGAGGRFPTAVLERMNEVLNALGEAPLA